MKLMMISGDRSVLEGKKSAFYYTLEEFSKHWERIDVICPRLPRAASQQLAMSDERTVAFFDKVYIHPSPYPLCLQTWWILKKGKQLFVQYHHNIATVHEYPPFYNGLGAYLLKVSVGLSYVMEIHHVVGYPVAASAIEWIGRVLSFLLLRFDAKPAVAIRTVSSSVRQTLLSFGVSPAKIHLIPSFYLDPILSQYEAPVTKQYDIVCVARLVANKGLQELLEAILLLPQRSLLIVGDGPLRRKYEAFVRANHLEDRVTFAGWIESKEEVTKLIRSAYMFVMNSKSEGGPRAALEAMACGVPVISTRVGVMPDVIEDRKNGLFTTGKALDLKEKIDMLLHDGRMQVQFHDLGPQVLRKFDRTRLIAEYAAFLQSFA